MFQLNASALVAMKSPEYPKILDRLMQLRGQIKQYISLIYCYRKPNVQQLEFRTVFFSDAFRSDNMPFDDRLEDDLSSLSGDSAFDTEFFLNFASSYYVAVIGQAVEDYLISIKEYQKAHFALDDSETIFRRTFGDFLHMGSPATVTRVIRLENYWYSDLEHFHKTCSFTRTAWCGRVSSCAPFLYRSANESSSSMNRAKAPAKLRSSLVSVLPPCGGFGSSSRRAARCNPKLINAGARRC
jgi:hypothetical protein